MEHEAVVQSLVTAAVNNETDAFRRLYEHLVNKVYAYVRYRIARDEDALDLTQEVFIDLYKALPQFMYESTAQFYSFVFVITKRKLAKWYARAETSMDAQAVSLNEHEIPAQANDTVAQDEVARALAQLDSETRDIIILHHWSRYTFKEIASLTNMTESAVRVRHHRALKTLSAFITVPV